MTYSPHKITYDWIGQTNRQYREHTINSQEFLGQFSTIRDYHLCGNKNYISFPGLQYLWKQQRLFTLDAGQETVHKDTPTGMLELRYLKDQLQELQCLCLQWRMECCNERKTKTKNSKNKATIPINKVDENFDKKLDQKQ